MILIMLSILIDVETELTGKLLKITYAQLSAMQRPEELIQENGTVQVTADYS